MLISTALQLAALGSKGVSGIVNTVRTNKEKNNLIGQRNSLEDWYRAESNQDYLNTAQSQKILALLRNTIKKNNEINANTSEVMGGTAEEQVANNEANNKAVADTMTGIAGQATEYKDSLRKDYLNQKANIDNKISAMNGNQIQSAVNAGSNAMNAFGSAVSANQLDAFGNQTVGGIFKDLFKKPKKPGMGVTDNSFQTTIPITPRVDPIVKTA